MGLPPFPEVGIPDRTTEIGQIGPILETRRQAVGNQIVGLQEVFHQPYYDSITGATGYSNESARTNDGPQGTGDGLAHLSDYSSTTPTHAAWTVCGPNSNDCLAPKGYTFTDFTLETGVSLHLYNLHMDAGQLQEDKDARTAQFGQLQTAMNTNSSGHAVIVMGDFNSRYTRIDDLADTFLIDQSLTDAWVQLGNGGIVPGTGSDIDSGCPPPRGNATGGDINASGNTCELIDKIMFRSSTTLALSLMSYEVLLNFIDGGSVALSDHLPVTAGFNYSVVPEPGTAALMLLGLAGLGAAGRKRA
jgi:endonuclease/exonuclease/phosphatase family metal-dependent hydrolase